MVCITQIVAKASKRSTIETVNFQLQNYNWLVLENGPKI